MNHLRLTLAALLALALVACTRPAAADPWQVPGLEQEVLSLALRARACALDATRVPKPDLLTVIDYSLHSRGKRLWVLDLAQQRVLESTWVAHGRGSEGPVDDGYPEVFSNEGASHASSLGLALTGAVNERSEHGFALALKGLEPGFNDRMAARSVVMHPADYVSRGMLLRTGRMGRSHGCPALPSTRDSDVARRVIDTIAGGSLVFSYYPDPGWLEHSPLLHCPATEAAPATTPAPTPAARAPSRGSWLDERWLREADTGEVQALARHLGGLGVETFYPNLAHGQPTPLPGAGGAEGWVPAPAATRALERPLEGGQAVRDVLSGVAWNRLDLPLTAERFDPGIGEGYLEAVRRGP
ncbi:MAG: murein L,D-transpeptidase catalytic domain family protein [Pseudomonadota bacterium]